jgi:hypothetical protein
MRDIPTELLSHGHIQLAIKIVSAYHTDNYGRFWQLLADAPYLFNCLMIPKFDDVRSQFLDRLCASYRQRFTPNKLNMNCNFGST